MLKTLTMSLSLALALSLTGTSKAGGLLHGGGDGCSTCASPQSAGGPSAQEPLPSPQGVCETSTKQGCHLFEKLSCGFGNLCGGVKEAGCGFKKSCGEMGGCFKDLCAKMKPKPKCYTYEWVLKKKRVWGCHGNCGSPACETCAVSPSGQYAPAASGQGGVAPAPQAGYSAPSYGSGQIAAAPYTYAPAAMTTTAPAPVGGDEAPPAPAAPEAPRLPNAAPPIPSTPAVPAAPPAPPAPGATTGLLFSTPSGN